MSWRLWRPRRIGAYEAQIVRRVLEVGAASPPSAALLASIDNLIVHEEGAGGFLYDSLDFNDSRENGTIIAGAIGLMANDASVELFLWARGDIITGLELEPFEETRCPIRMPRLETICPYPHDTGDDEEDGENVEAKEPIPHRGRTDSSS